ncbi:putative structural protein [Vibrio phage VP06]|nr:putative structural protein [Vibrio phage VP06]
MTKKTSPFAMFRTSTNDEVNGVYVNYGSFRVLVAYAGGANTAFNRLLQKLGKPYLKLIKSGNLPEEVTKEIDEKLYSQTIVKGFQVDESEVGADEPKWVTGIPTEEGDVVEFNEENLIKLFRELPHLFEDIKAFAQDMSNFKPDLEVAKGN